MAALGTAVRSAGFPGSLEAYLSLLRAEILQAQSLRMQAQAAKTVFLGGLFAYALPQNDALALLVAPFAAFAFDCIGYGLTYNIQEIGAYIRDHIEPALPQPGTAASGAGFMYWETAKRRADRRDWGRLLARMGNYAVTFLACIVSFSVNWARFRWEILAGLLALIVILYTILLILETRTRDLSRGVTFPSPER